jgi:hypothetical protein
MGVGLDFEIGICDCRGCECISQYCVVYTYLGVGSAASDGIAAVAVGGLGRHFCSCLYGDFCWVEVTKSECLVFLEWSC